ncbi:MAG: M48 family metalloprotease [Candidatus Riflebacteria bacterium]|nr:M48 family metalloprotease [Candidatus Riflebacteria bacterium]
MAAFVEPALPKAGGLGYHGRMRTALLCVVLLLLGIIIGVDSVRSGPPPGFPPVGEIRALIRQRAPHVFLEELADAMSAMTLDGADLRALLAVLDQRSIQETAAEAATVEAIRGILLLENGHPADAMPRLGRALRDSEDHDERAAILQQLYQAAWSAGREDEFRRLTSDTALLKEFPGELEFSLKALAGRNLGPPAKRQLKMAMGWLILLLLPWFIGEWRVRRWRQQFPAGSDRQGPYFAFSRTPVAATASFFSAALALACNLPAGFGFARAFWPGVIHLAAAWLLAGWPAFRLDREVRGTTWSYAAWLRNVTGMAAVNAVLLVVPVAAWFILRAMTAGLPLWPVTWPLGVGLGFPALCGALFLLYPLLVPWLLPMRRVPADRCPDWAAGLGVPLYRWNTDGGKIFNALTFGYLTPTQAIAVTSSFADGFPPGTLTAILEHEKGHLARGHLFTYFLLLLAASLVGGVYAVTWPLQVQRWLMTGPTPGQLIWFLAVILTVTVVFRRLARDYEVEADASAAAAVGRETYLQALTDLTLANFLPERVRAGEEPLGIHPPLQERKRRLRVADGDYFETGRPPAPAILVALWRSRLALDWKAGQAEAEHLCALDYHLTATDPAGRLKELAARHAGFGAEALVRGDGSGLEILACAQKACARRADPPLPADRLCLLCSAGMQAALNEPGLAWSAAPNGCRLLRPGKGTE